MRTGKSKKMVVIVTIAFLTIVILWLVSIHPRIYLKDYPSIYKEQLDTIFGSNYTIGPRAAISKFEEHIDHSATYVYYYSWEITYKDQLGEEYKIELVNRKTTKKENDYYSFENQVFRWTREQVEDHFNGRCHQSIENIGTDTFSSIVFLFNYYSEIAGDNTLAESARSFRANEIDSLLILQNLPHLYNFDYSSWFNKYPAYLKVYITPDTVENFTISESDVYYLFNECGNKFNAIIELDYRIKNKLEFEAQYFLMGEKQDFKNDDEFRLALFYEYEKKGMFD